MLQSSIALSIFIMRCLFLWNAHVKVNIRILILFRLGRLSSATIKTP